MTLSTEYRKARYEGNDAATVFPLPFKVFGKEELGVVRLDAAGTEHRLRLDSDYSLHLNEDQNANPGGSVSYPQGDRPKLQRQEWLILFGDLKNRQETSLPNHGAYNSSTLEKLADRIVMMIQQLDEKRKRSITLPVSD